VKLIVGLGNPGVRYRHTPHNIGFMVAETLAERLAIGFKRRPMMKARTAVGQYEGDSIVILQPQTFMNLSGDAVMRVARYYRVTVGEILVIVDDADLAFESLRLRSKGGAGGHRGLVSIFTRLESDAIARLRIGIGRSARGGSLVDHVLSPFDASETEQVGRVVGRAADAALCWATRGVEAAMNDYNVRSVDQ